MKWDPEICQLLPFILLSCLQTEKLQKSLEAELLSLKERVSELENDCSLKSEQLASAAAEKEEAIASALAEITHLKQETLTKMWDMRLICGFWSYSYFGC